MDAGVERRDIDTQLTEVDPNIRRLEYPEIVLQKDAGDLKPGDIFYARCQFKVLRIEEGQLSFSKDLTDEHRTTLQMITFNPEKVREKGLPQHRTPPAHGIPMSDQGA